MGRDALAVIAPIGDRIALAFVVVLCMCGGPVWAEVVDGPRPPTQNERLLDEKELWSFVAPATDYDLVDLETSEQGNIHVGDGRISISWYFGGEAEVAVLTRRGSSCIVVRRDQDQTKCISVWEDPLSKSCRFLVYESHDRRAACLRKSQTP